MMKTDKRMPLAVYAALLITATASCDDWGKMDPPAGNQVIPTLQNVATFDFEADDAIDPATWQLFANPGGILPAVVEDDTKGKVLEINGGYASLPNPLNSVTLQEAVSLTFWIMQPVEADVDEDGNETPHPQDLASPIVAFENATANGRLFLNANGGINYSAADGEWIENDPATVTTGYLKPGEWHYVAVVIDNDGYDYYVDGDRKVSKPVLDFDCSKLVKFANNVPVMTVGGKETSSRWLIDDLKVYRNKLSAKETARPNIGGGGNDGPGIDLNSWVLVGNEDNSTGFWTSWSPYLDLTGNGTIHYDFYNYHGGKTDNWCNWLLVLTNGIERGGDGYLEYIVLRSDAYGWGTLYDASMGSMKHDFDFGTFMSEMDGAFVSLDIVRNGAEATVTAIVTAENGTVRNYSITVSGIEGETLGSFLTCEGSHLLINPDTAFVGQTLTKDNIVGADDFSTPFFGAQSPLYFFEAPFTNFGIEFINHATGNGANWNNWVLANTNGKAFGEDGYAENWVLRSDAYGWGASFDTGDTTIEAAFDWDNYPADMKDCKVNLLFSYDGNEFGMLCRQTTADGRNMPDYRFYCKNMALPMGLFLTLEGCWLEINKVGYYPLASMK